jgi:Zn-dependent alcohol dehydrogenase
LSPTGTFVAVGLVQADTKIVIPVQKLLCGQTVTGALFGNYKGRDGVLQLVKKYQNDSKFKKLINLFISKKFKLDQINEAFDLLKRGDNVIRSVIVY